MSGMTFLTFLKIITRRYFRFIVIILFVLVLLAAYLYKGNTFFQNPNTVAENVNKALIEKVGKIVFLPQDEIPTIARVANPEILKDKVFFAEAKTGDVVLIYTNAKKAILYDPVANKIINMSNVNIGDTKKNTTSAPSISIPDEKSGTPNEF